MNLQITKTQINYAKYYFGGLNPENRQQLFEQLRQFPKEWAVPLAFIIRNYFNLLPLDIGRDWSTLCVKQNWGPRTCFSSSNFYCPPTPCIPQPVFRKAFYTAIFEHQPVADKPALLQCNPIQIIQQNCYSMGHPQGIKMFDQAAKTTFKHSTKKDPLSIVPRNCYSSSHAYNTEMFDETAKKDHLSIAPRTCYTYGTVRQYLKTNYI